MDRWGELRRVTMMTTLYSEKRVSVYEASYNYLFFLSCPCFCRVIHQKNEKEELVDIRDGRQRIQKKKNANIGNKNKTKTKRRIGVKSEKCITALYQSSRRTRVLLPTRLEMRRRASSPTSPSAVHYFPPFENKVPPIYSYIHTLLVYCFRKYGTCKYFIILPTVCIRTSCVYVYSGLSSVSTNRRSAAGGCRRARRHLCHRSTRKT